jgi:hypothetical protein
MTVARAGEDPTRTYASKYMRLQIHAFYPVPAMVLWSM